MAASKTWGKINTVNIAAPSSYEEAFDVIGGYNVTLRGTKRRYIKAIKKIWRLHYSFLSASDYDEFYTEYAREMPSGIQASDPNTTFTINDARFHVNGESVHMDMDRREVVPGTDVLTDIGITLTQV